MKESRVERCSRWSKKLLRSFPTTPHKAVSNLIQVLKSEVSTREGKEKAGLLYITLTSKMTMKRKYIISKSVENIKRQKKKIEKRCQNK